LLKIEANNVEELVKILWSKMSYGDMELIGDISNQIKKSAGSLDSLNMVFKDRSLHGNESWIKEDKVKSTVAKYDQMNKMREDYIQMACNPLVVVPTPGHSHSTGIACGYGGHTHTITQPEYGFQYASLVQKDTQKNNNKEQSMYLSINTTGNLDAQQKNYFGNRAVEIFYAQKEALKNQFGLVDDEAPRNAKELAERIAAGKFVIDTEKKDSDWDFSIRRAFSWRDPSVKKDEDGYKAARKELDKKLTETKDIIVASTDAKEALEAVKSLETATFH
jgi:hypothetical protein